MNIGFHFSIQPSMDEVPNKAKEFGCNTFQIFTRSNRQWKSKPISEELAEKFKLNYRHTGFSTSAIHLPYLPNFATSDKTIIEKSLNSLKQEITRAQQLDIPNIIMHLGSHKGEGDQIGIDNVVKALDKVIPQLNRTKLCLETAAGHPSSVGKTFDELNLIIEGVSDQKNIGVCIDTAHIFAAGYDIRTPDAVESVFEEFYDIVGKNKLLAIHLNDSKADLNAQLDRHEHLGQGKIGLEGFRFILKKCVKTDFPIIMETPKEDNYGDIENWNTVQSILKRRVINGVLIILQVNLLNKRMFNVS